MNSNCREIEAQLSPYLDGELDEVTTRRVEEHLAGCAACRDALAAIRETERVLAGAMPMRSDAEWEALALRVEMAIDREEARILREEAANEMAGASTFVAARSAAEPEKAAPQRKGILGWWWAYGSGAIATAMLVLLLWPWFSERVEEGPPVPSTRTRSMEPDRALEKDASSESAPSTLMEQEQLSTEPAAPGVAGEELPSEALGEKSPPVANDLDAAKPNQTPSASGREMKIAPPPTDSNMRESFTAGKDEASREAAQNAPESGGAAGSRDAAGAEPTTPQRKAAAPSEPREESRSTMKVRGVVPQPMSKEPANQWRSADGVGRLKSKSGSPAPSDSPPPAVVEHFSETEWAEASELQTQEAFKVGTEKALGEAAHVQESFLKEFPRSVFRTRIAANFVRTTAALSQLNSDIWCERALAALEIWKLEKPSPAMNLDAEIASIESRCVK
jgi:anti-sigma factor RsiW